MTSEAATPPHPGHDQYQTVNQCSRRKRLGVRWCHFVLIISDLFQCQAASIYPADWFTLRFTQCQNLHINTHQWTQYGLLVKLTRHSDSKNTDRITSPLSANTSIVSHIDLVHKLNKGRIHSLLLHTDILQTLFELHSLLQHWYSDICHSN